MCSTVEAQTVASCREDLGGVVVVTHSVPSEQQTATAALSSGDADISEVASNDDQKVQTNAHFGGTSICFFF